MPPRYIPAARAYIIPVAPMVPLRRQPMRVWTILPAIFLITTLSLAADTKPSTQPSPDTYKVKKGSLKLEVSTDATLSALEPFEAKLKSKAYTGQFMVVSAAAHGAMVRKG